MKKCIVIILSFCTQLAQSQTNLAIWTFDGLAATPNTSTLIAPALNGESQSLTAAIYADGTNGSSLWKTSSSGNEITSQAGTNLNDPRTPTVAGNALTLANSSANGKSIVVKFSMLGLRDPVVTFMLRSTATGFSNHVWSWSTDGIAFSVAESYTINRSSTFYLQTLDLSSVNELDGAQDVYLKLTVSGATAASGNNRIDNMILSATIPALPIFSTDFPKIQSVTTHGFAIKVMLTTVGTSYFVVLESQATAPLPAQIKAQQDGDGNAIGLAGSVLCAIPNSEFHFEFHELSSEHHYTVYVVAGNQDGLQLAPVKLDVTTLPEGDHVAPTFLESPVARSYNTSIILKLSLNEPGRLFSVAVDAGNVAPTVSQVISGLDDQNIPVRNESTTVVRAGIEYPVVLNNLNSSKEYDVYLVAMDTAENVQPAPTKLTVTTEVSPQPIPNSLTVATYNLDFFASNVRSDRNVEFGPADDTLQVTNVRAVLKVIGADIFAMQEIANDDALKEVVRGIPNYDLVISDRWSHSWQAPDPQFPSQKIGFVYDTTVVTLVDHEVLFSGLYDSIQAGSNELSDYPGGDPTAFWSSGRLPFTARFDVSVDSIVQRIRLVTIHSKSGSAPEDYNRRVYDVQYLFDYLTTHFKDDKIILLGDFNDDVDQSVSASAVSPYRDFLDDTAAYQVITYELSQSGQSSFPALNSFIDHVIISSELNGGYLANSATIVDADGFIGDYLETTSDHLPVSATFLIKLDQSISFPPFTQKTYGSQPFTLSALTTSTQPIVYTSADPNVASVIGNELTIMKAGATDIIAAQSGNESYYPAAAVTRRLVIDKAGQVITFEPVGDKTLGDEPFNLVASTSSALRPGFSSSSQNISIAGDRVTLLGAGRTSILVSQQGNENYLPATANIVFCIAPSAAIITSDLSTPAILSSSAPSGNQWFLNGSPIPGAIGPELKTTQSGKYTVQVSADNCHSIFSNEIQLAITGLTDANDPVITFYPNPAQEYVEILGLAERASVKVYDLRGIERAVSMERNDMNIRIVVSDLPPGMYVVRVGDGKKVQTGKFVRQ